MNTIVDEVREIDRWIDSCYKRGDLHEFHPLMDVGITIGNHLRKLAIVTVSTITEDESDSNEPTIALHDAVIVGHMVRLYKLYDQLVYFVSEDKGEIASIFSRLLFETYVIMKYLILKGSPSIENYIRVSFKSTIKEYNFIKGLEAQRPLTDIESRIVRKVEARLKNAGLDAAELANTKSWKLDGLSFKGIVEYLSQHDDNPDFWALSYDFLYGNMSSFIHGLWYDLEINHLRRHGERFSPKLEYDRVDPRYILPSSLIPVVACIDFLTWRKTDPDHFLRDVLDKMGDLVVFLNQMDEVRIAKRGTA